MLVANSIVLTSSLLAFQADSLPGIIRFRVFPMFGLLFCVAWLAMTAWGSELADYKAKSVRELENHLYVVDTVSRGAHYHSGKPVGVRVQGEREPYRLSWVGRLCQVRWMKILVICMFAVMHLLLLLGW